MAGKVKYDDRFVKIAKVLCMRGGTDEDLAEAFGVSRRTIIRWKKEHEDFYEAMTEGKDYADSEVELSLYKRAKGIKKKTSVTKKIVEMDKDGTFGRPEFENPSSRLPYDLTVYLMQPF